MRYRRLSYRYTLVLAPGQPNHRQHFRDALFQEGSFQAIEPAMKFKDFPAVVGGSGKPWPLDEK